MVLISSVDILHIADANWLFLVASKFSPSLLAVAL